MLALESPEAGVVRLVGDVLGGAVGGAVGVGGQGPAQVLVSTQAVAGSHHLGRSGAAHGAVRVVGEVQVLHVVGPQAGAEAPVVQHQVPGLEGDLGHHHGDTPPLQTKSEVTVG